jgi:hypothetical protein
MTLYIGRRTTMKAIIRVVVVMLMMMVNLLDVLFHDDHDRFSSFVLPVVAIDAAAATTTTAAFDSNISDSDECTVHADGTTTCAPTTPTTEPDDSMWKITTTYDDDGGTFMEIGTSLLGVAQSVENGHTTDIQQRLLEVRNYMKDRILDDNDNNEDDDNNNNEDDDDDDVLHQQQELVNECQLRHELCAYWAVLGECEINPGNNLFLMFLLVGLYQM